MRKIRHLGKQNGCRNQHFSYLLNWNLILWLWSFLYPPLGTALIFTNLHLAWTGMDIFNVYCLARTFFFGPHVSRIENWSSTLIHSTVYTLLKWRTRKFNFRSYVLNLVKINIRFFLSKVGSPGPIYRPAMSSMYYQFSRFIGQVCQNSRIERADLLTKCAN